MKYSKQHIIEKKKINQIILLIKMPMNYITFCRNFWLKKILFLIVKIEKKPNFLKTTITQTKKLKSDKIIPTLQVLLLYDDCTYTIQINER